MTVVTGTIENVGFSPLSGTLVARAVRFTPADEVLVAPEGVPFPIAGGVVSADLAPGPVLLTVQVGSHARESWEVTVPEDGPVLLADLVEGATVWDPPSVSRAIQAAREALAAAKRSETAAGTSEREADRSDREANRSRDEAARSEEARDKSREHRDDAEGYRDQALKHRDDARAARDESRTARDTAELHRDDALDYRDTAKEHRDDTFDYAQQVEALKPFFEQAELNVGGMYADIEVMHQAVQDVLPQLVLNGGGADSFEVVADLPATGVAGRIYFTAEEG